MRGDRTLDELPSRFSHQPYSAVGAPQAVLGWFMRVWRLERDSWRIVLDVTNPAPAK